MSPESSSKNNYVLSQLTFRELEILKEVKKGRSCQEISDKLFIGIETVKTHRKNIINKLGLKGKLEFRKFIMTLLAEESIRIYGNSPQSPPKG
ncbi:hypothetical protein GCM10011506_37490 [Marivirga lumbricoides]|uniref:HTH luxR-type domain-containing protein n=1 Tax=Marivirga lumbricoides TaxID=1046115 RepID=A0ABQ1MWE0_9BACT|nr:hypothetical protein GCM10011506_37490 [Marivirga lumbricoides]